MVIIDVTTFKTELDIEIADAKVQDALDVAISSLFNLIKIRQELQIQSQDTSQLIHLQDRYLLSRTLDSTFVANDIEVYEYDPSDYTETNLNGNITSLTQIKLVKDNKAKLVFDTNVPTATTKTAIIRFHVTYLDLTDDAIIEQAIKWIKLKAFNLLNKDILLALNQNGISEWNLNGVSVRADNDSMKSLVETNEQDMVEIYNNMMPLVIHRTRTNNVWLGHSYRRNTSPLSRGY